jgi:maleylacetate reductase
MYEFTYTTQASRVVFGAGSMKLIQQEEPAGP